MAHSVCSPCVGTHDTACMKVCPVNCFYDVPLSDIGVAEPAGAADNPALKNVLLISPDECIDCGLCVPECPVQAIFPNDEVPEEEKQWVDINANFFKDKSQETLDGLRITP